MAAEGENKAELKSHVQSYSTFSSMMKWGTILSFIVAMLVVVIISN